MAMLFVIKQEVLPTKGMAPPTFHTFRARNANLYLCGRGMLWCRACLVPSRSRSLIWGIFYHHPPLALRARLQSPRSRSALTRDPSSRVKIRAWSLLSRQNPRLLGLGKACGGGRCRASFKLNMLQNLMKPKYIDKNMKNNFLTFNRIFLAKMKHILSVTVVENMQVVCSCLPFDD